jgi:hypothetical protein
MKHPFLIMLLASSTIFSIEETSRFKALKQKLFGKYLITKARENNCPNVAELLQDLRIYTPEEFANKSTFEHVIQIDPKIKQIILDIYSHKHWKPLNEHDFAATIKMLKKTKAEEQQANITDGVNAFLFIILFPISLIIIPLAIIQAENQRIESDVTPYSLEELLQKAEEKITAARSALAAAAEKEATTD